MIRPTQENRPYADVDGGDKMPGTRGLEAQPHAVQKHAIAILALICLITTLAYLPAMRGGFIWDDDGHVTRPELRSVDGLYRIWFEVGATQQYYPLLHSLFWLEYQLWGDDTFGYHATNMLLHCVVVCLVYAVLWRLRIPGALLAAAIFAIHPVMVESVAWITEQKNTLSAVFYLSAVLAYLRFDETCQRSWYWGTLALFLLGLAAKTVTATLPAALLVIFWWQRGRLDWRKEVPPLVPFFAIGAVAGVFTAWVERKLIGAQGAEFELTFLERGLIAGRAIWFYLGKLVWPVDLTFIYPRWKLDATAWWQWLFPLAALAMTGVMWGVHRRWRGPLAGWLFFVGTLFPVLGFLNVFPFIYSFVADHFQYLASLGVIALFASAVSLLVARLPQRGQMAGNSACVALVGVLAVLTWRQCGMYSDLDTLYQTTIARNPVCWMAYNNLGVHVAKDKLDDAAAMKHYRQALELKPDYADTHFNLANALMRTGDREAALAEFKQALLLRPNFPDYQNNLANLLKAMGRLPEAVDLLERAASEEPDDAVFQINLGAAFFATGEMDRAIDCYERAVRLEPDDVTFRNRLAKALLNSKRPIPEAIEQAIAAIRLDQDNAEAHQILGLALVRAGQASAAIKEFQETIRLTPQLADAYFNLAKAYATLGRSEEVVTAATAAIALAKSSGNQDAAGQIEAWLANYRANPPKGSGPTQAGPSH